MFDPIYQIFALIVLVALGKEAYEDFYEDRRTKAWVCVGFMGLVVVLDLLFGFGFLAKLAK